MATGEFAIREDTRDHLDGDVAVLYEPRILADEHGAYPPGWLVRGASKMVADFLHTLAEEGEGPAPEHIRVDGLALRDLVVVPRRRMPDCGAMTAAECSYFTQTEVRCTFRQTSHSDK